MIDSLISALLYDIIISEYSNDSMKHNVICIDRECMHKKLKRKMALRLDIILIVSVIIMYCVDSLVSTIFKSGFEYASAIIGLILGMALYFIYSYIMYRALESENLIYKRYDLKNKYDVGEVRKIVVSIPRLLARIVIFGLFFVSYICKIDKWYYANDMFGNAAVIALLIEITVSLVSIIVNNKSKEYIVTMNRTLKLYRYSKGSGSIPCTYGEDKKELVLYGKEQILIDCENTALIIRENEIIRVVNINNIRISTDNIYVADSETGNRFIVECKNENSIDNV